MFSDSFPYYKVFVFIPNFVLIILNFFFESLEICKKLQASQNCNMSLHLHSLLWFTSSFSPVQARQQTKCLVSSSPYPSQSPLLTPGYVLKYKFIHHCGYTAMSFTRCQQHSIVTSCWPQLIWSKLLDPQPHMELFTFPDLHFEERCSPSLWSKKLISSSRSPSNFSLLSEDMLKLSIMYMLSKTSILIQHFLLHISFSYWYVYISYLGNVLKARSLNCHK